MTDVAELTLIQRDIEETRKRIALDRRLLAEQLAPHGANPDLVDALLTACDEFGVTQVRDQIATAPEHFQLTALPPGKLAVVGQLLDQLTDAGMDFDRLVGARENILAKTDPDRARVTPWFGREFVLDSDGRSLRFADAPDLPEPVTVVTVPNRAAPTHGPDADATLVSARQRHRQRDR